MQGAFAEMWYRIAALSALLLVVGCCARAQQYVTDPDNPPANTEMQRQEIVNIENETARAILLSNGTFFRRVYSDDFAGTLSHGQPVDRANFIRAIEQTDVKYQVFVAGDIKVRIYQELAVATCLWTARGVYRGKPFNSQMRVMHVYINGPRGWQVISEQNTALPPDALQPL
jgi:uncharacterized protein DUF4440